MLDSLPLFLRGKPNDLLARLAVGDSARVLPDAFALVFSHPLPAVIDEVLFFTARLEFQARRRGNIRG